MIDISLTTEDDVGNFRQTIYAVESDAEVLNVIYLFYTNYCLLTFY